MTVKIPQALSRFFTPLLQDGETPPEIFTALRGVDANRVKRMWKNANSTFHLVKELSSRGKAELVGKPSTVFIKVVKGTPYYMLRFPSVTVYVSLDDIDEETANMIQEEMLYITVVAKNNKYIATDVTPLVAKSKVERGEELYEVATQSGIPLDEIPAMAYGYATPSMGVRDDKVNRLSLLMLYRFFTVTRVLTPLHAFELTTVNTGKTSFAVRNRFVFNWEYIDEPPSYARLIMDARNNALGVVYRSNGVFIDEIEKYASDMKDILPALLSGMSHGVWTRAKGDTSAPNVVRWVAMYLAGNKTNATVTKVSPRQYVYDILTSMKLGDSLVTALLDRIGIVITNDAPINASDYVSGSVILDSYLRGYAEYISVLAKQKLKDLGIGEGRRRQQINTVYALCVVATQFNNCEKLAEEVEQGFLV
ncbi:putative superfamily 6 helicase [Sulfolobales Beppu filamentous virus 3]|uniref:Putative superfamily 6 helicase n=1 Tax=Sulfolobales Beppu filamentous virus 3 TaxID=2493124 RepID=A0A3S8NEZ6_9VIRU|nr:protease [Sulfolobales Beppu filamentous virus 3]AZI75847.1 putative superfamily 6 helicase [Sulfolobales Beppu filamentous virus 3]